MANNLGSMEEVKQGRPEVVVRREEVRDVQLKK